MSIEAESLAFTAAVFESVEIGTTYHYHDHAQSAITFIANKEATTMPLGSLLNKSSGGRREHVLEIIRLRDAALRLREGDSKKQ